MVNCSCGREGIVYLSYANRTLCTKHFLDYFEKRVKRTIREFSLLNGVKHLGIALSGGKDSLTTLYLLHKIAGPMKMRITAILVDEGINGYRNETIKDAKRICGGLKVPLKIFEFKKEIGTTMDKIMKRGEREVSCTYCGVFRRWILNKASKKLKIDKLAIGHNLDDVIQSFLMNALRNEPFRLARFGPRSGIVEDEGFVQRIRPLFRIPEKEVALYAVLKNLKYKFVECPYIKEAFRPKIRDFLNDTESSYPGTKFKILNFYKEIRGYLEEKYKRNVENIAKCQECNEPTSKKICKRCELLKTLNVKK